MSAPLLASEPDESLIRTANLPDSTPYAREIVDKYLHKMAKESDRVLQDIVSNDMKVKIGRRKRNHHHRARWVDVFHTFESIDEAAKYAFAKAFFDFNYKSLDDIGSPLIEHYVHQSVDRNILNLDPNNRMKSPILFFTSRFPMMVSGGIANICGQNLG